MSKTKKTLIGLGIAVFLVGLIAIIVCLNVIPGPTKQYIKTAWEWLNAPLPIISISVLTLAILLWKIFAGSSFGKKKINEFKRESEETRESFEQHEKRVLERINAFEEIMKTFGERLEQNEKNTIEICQASPNSKIKKIGEKLNGIKKEEQETTHD